jgi:hypothetical protein
MPNWCECDLYITGEPEEIDRCLESIKDEETAISFQRILPRPAALDISSPAHTEDEQKQAEENMNLYGVPDWYQWNLNNWGTKWDTHEAYAEKVERGVAIYFKTPWAPPIPVIRVLSSIWPNLVFDLSYFECGMQFQGKAAFSRGESIMMSEGDYDGDRGG